MCIPMWVMTVNVFGYLLIGVAAGLMVYVTNEALRSQK